MVKPHLRSTTISISNEVKLLAIINKHNKVARLLITNESVRQSLRLGSTIITALHSQINEHDNKLNTIYQLCKKQ